MRLKYERVCGMDVHKDMIKACVRRPGSGPEREELVKTFGTITRELQRLREWLQALGVTHVAMESTGIYWKPVYYMLEGDFTILVVNPASIKNIGHKTDVRDARWIAQLLECDLLRGSYVPPRPIRSLRSLTRYRKKVMEQRVEEIQRLQAVLQDAGIMLGSVASTVRGASARAMIAALAAGKTDADELAELAVGSLRNKREELRFALEGHFDPTHGFLVKEILDHLEHLDGMLIRLNEEINRQLQPYAEEVKLLQTIPGVKERTTQVIIAELGVNMDPFPTAGQAASWGCLCPMSNQSAGKRKVEHVRKRVGGLRPALVQAAWAAVRENDSYLAAQFHRLAGHMLKKKAILAVAHSLLEIAYYVLKERKPYQDLGPDYFLKRNKEAVQKRCVRQLERLGFKVNIVTTGVAEAPSSGDAEQPATLTVEVLAQAETPNPPTAPPKPRTGRKARGCRSPKPSVRLGQTKPRSAIEMGRKEAQTSEGAVQPAPNVGVPVQPTTRVRRRRSRNPGLGGKPRPVEARSGA